MKKCTRCLEVKQFNQFHKGKNYKDGYRSICKNCHNITQNQADRKRSLKNKPLCAYGCGTKLDLHEKKYCKKCVRLLQNERQRKIYATEEYRNKHREYMRKYLNINEKNFRVN